MNDGDIVKEGHLKRLKVSIKENGQFEFPHRSSIREVLWSYARRVRQRASVELFP